MRPRFFSLTVALMALLIDVQGAYAQITDSKFFIFFKDKNNSPYSLSNPSAFLSQRAIDRRANQGINYSLQDIPVNPQYIDSVMMKGATVWARSKWFNGVVISVPDSATYYAVLSLPFVKSEIKVKGKTDGGKIRKFDEHNFFDGASIEGKSTVNNVNSFYRYGQSFNQIHLMNGDYLHDLGFHGEGMIIALLDAGFFNVDVFTPFDSLRANNQILATWDFVANEPFVYEDHWHGASVLSCIAGYVPDSLVGTAPKANFLLLRSEDAPTEYIVEEYNWAAAAEYADSAGADIISSSLGYSDFDDSTMNHTYADMNGNTAPASIAADIAASKGMLVIVSAGNSGSSPWHYITAPSDGDSVLAIGAVDSNGFHASFSGNGPSSDGDVKPNVDAKGVFTTVELWTGFVSVGNGTSFSAPVLAGSAACLWQAHPGAKAMEIFNAIQQSGNYYSAPNDSLGYGIPDFKMADKLLTIKQNRPLVTELIVYPNPFHDKLWLNYLSPKERSITVEIFSLVGQQLFSSEFDVDGITPFSVPTANLAKGVYFIKVTNNEGSFIRKIVKG